MTNKIFAAVLFLSLSILSSFINVKHDNEDILYYTIDPGKTTVKMFWKDDEGKPLKNLQALKDYCAVKNEKLLFAMNGGMYKTDNSPLGLYIQEGKTLAPVNNRNGGGNFYLQPNGIFYITKNKTAGISTTNSFIDSGNIVYATQSGPMLLVNGSINTVFTKGSANTNIRNGVGILPGNKVIFAMSKKEISFYDFASFFKKAGCSNALYLDGFVSRTYLPGKNWVQTGGNFGVMIATVSKQ